MATHGYAKFAGFEALKGKGDQVKVSYNVGPPFTIAKLVHNSNFTMVYR
jgi:hypothetical protein